MNFDMMHPAEQIVMIMDRIYKYGMTTTSGGNLSIMDSDGDIWITPGGIDKGSLTVEDIIQIKPDGTIIGRHKPSSELPFHRALIHHRKGTKAVLHAHPPALVAFSIVRQNPKTDITTELFRLYQRGGIKMAKYEIPGSELLGDRILEVFKENINTVMLENHGVVIASDNLFDAFKIFETLEFGARLEINSRILGEPKSLTAEDYEVATNTQMPPELSDYDDHITTSYEKKERAKMCNFVKRAYQQRLFSSTQGTYSRRIAGNAFIITPFDKDRMYLEPDDIVAVNAEGMREKGKIPSRSVRLHEEIYKMHPEINSVIIAYPPNVMAFAITDHEFDSRTIPESYIMLRDIPRLLFHTAYSEPKTVANAISESTPVIMVQNSCIITTGSSMLQAYDRLEVAEFSAKALIFSKQLGDIVPISQQQVEEINESFHLK
ncbi:MAG: class II aldolase/adducin family protein [Ruminococcaceae bacterium]|nr:class II aldolase/adducin family protein [Oscillospiraceae bacterium]